MKLGHRAKVWSGVIVLIILFLPFFVESGRIISVFIDIGISTIAVSGVAFLFGYGGFLSLGHAAFMSVGAYIPTILNLNFRIPLNWCILLTFALALLIGFALSPILKLRKFYFAVATVGFNNLIVCLLRGLSKWTGGSNGMSDISPFSIGGFVFDSDIKYYYLVWVIVFGLVWIIRNLMSSRVGRNLLAGQLDERTAWTLGVNTFSYQRIAFLFSAALATLAGFLLSSHMRFASPDMFIVFRSVEFVLMGLVGGLQSAWGALLGTTIIKLLSQLALIEFTELVNGLLLVLFLVFLPGGVTGAVPLLVRRLMSNLPGFLGITKRHLHNG